MADAAPLVDGVVQSISPKTARLMAATGRRYPAAATDPVR
jgi:hypothetical protein